jgi:tRNA nucleotidyltransferase/poly(A) polymerase
MKLRELLQQMKSIQEKIGSSEPYICGGTPRDRYLKHLENISDLDITTGDKTVQYLAQEFGSELSKQYNVTRRSHDDGHSSIYIGSFKIDFSSNFNVTNIDALLAKKGIKNPTEMQKEMFSRDFTCNALLLSLDLKNLLDPTQQGFKDINNRVIKTCLDPEITLTSNKNRVVRAIYLSSKLDFDIDPSIVEFVTAHPQSVKISTDKVMAEKINEAFNRNPERANYYVTKMNLWNYIPITDVVQPYYMKRAYKKAYFQGGGGVNEPTPKKKKYKSEKAIVVQPRFKEPFYHNYDLYETEGVDGPPKLGPGAGWNDMHQYKSISEFLKAKRKRMKDKYKADDAWIEDNEKNYQERVDKMTTRAILLFRLVKTAIDFETDNQIGEPNIAFNEETVEYPRYLGPAGPPGDVATFPSAPNLGDEKSYPYSAEIGGDQVYPYPDFEGKLVQNLDFGRDYTEDSLPFEYQDMEFDPEKYEDIFEKLMQKYLPAPPSLYGLPDGVDMLEEDLTDPTDINPDYGTYGPESQMYEDKWNI